MSLSIIGIILIIISCNIKIKKDKQQEQYKINLSQEITCISSNLKILENQQAKTQILIEQLNTEFEQRKNNQKKQLELYRNEIQRKKQKLKQECNIYYKAKENEMQHYYNLELEKTQNYYQEYVTTIENEKTELNKEIDKLKSTLAAAIQNDLREKQKKDKINFYKLSISDEDLADVKMLQNLKLSFHKPVVLSKLIWSQYFPKQTTDLCNRVLKNKTVCGIYKITNLITKEHYVGQSKNIGERWKAHCKCGLGIEASSTNTLYNNMQKYGIWNFSFEVLQVCPPQQLNEKEQFWIEVYKSNIYGLNTQSGIKKRGTA